MTLLAIVVLLALVVAVIVPARLRAVAWVALILIGVVPWTDYQGHSHWAQVGWWPFLSPPVRLRDVILNVVLYLPIGWHLVRRHQWHWAAAVASGVVLSCATEFTQVYSHERFATTTDIVTNTLGAVIGAVAASRLRGDDEANGGVAPIWPDAPSGQA